MIFSCQRLLILQFSREQIILKTSLSRQSAAVMPEVRLQVTKRRKARSECVRTSSKIVF